MEESVLLDKYEYQEYLDNAGRIKQILERIEELEEQLKLSQQREEATLWSATNREKRIVELEKEIENWKQRFETSYNEQGFDYEKRIAELKDRLAAQTGGRW